MLPSGLFVHLNFLWLSNSRPDVLQHSCPTPRISFDACISIQRSHHAVGWMGCRTVCYCPAIHLEVIFLKLTPQFQCWPSNPLLLCYPLIRNMASQVQGWSHCEIVVLDSKLRMKFLEKTMQSPPSINLLPIPILHSRAWHHWAQLKTSSPSEDMKEDMMNQLSPCHGPTDLFSVRESEKKGIFTL